VKKPSKIIFNKPQSNISSSSSSNKKVKQNKNLLLNKSKSEIFAKKINKQHNSRIEQQAEENSILRRRNVLNYSMPRLLHAQLSISNSKSSQNNIQLDSSLPTTTKTLQSETNSKYFNSKFFLPSDKSSTTGSTTSDDEIEEEIETYKFEPENEKKQPQQSDIDDVEEYDYDLNEGDLSDSDQTESCILNDANNNDILDENKSNEFIENNNNHLIDSNDENNNNLKFNNTKKYRSNSIGLSAVKEKISCIIWHNNEWKGVDLSMLEISNCIIMNVKKASLSVDYFYVGIIFSILIGLMPIYYQNNERIFILSSTSSSNNETISESQQSLFNYMPFNMLCLSSVIETINFWINIEPK
jgi:hypothetical protein